ncbi:MAG: ribosome biogenesis GTPase Der [Desulfurellaceae bacterium]|nr:ribosome biogenesis GTPase Der [Desulfurellaceae bacterium]
MARTRSTPSQDLDSPAQRDQLPVVAIVGRPNAGKSTFFNRLSHNRKAVVHATPGVTRDRNFVRATWRGRQFVLVDTGGIDPTETAGVVGRVQHQTQLAIDEADALIFLFDGREGLNPADTQAVDLLRRSRKPVLFAVNKLDSQKHATLVSDFFSLGIAPLYPISAAHGLGIGDLLDGLTQGWERDTPPPEQAADTALPVAIIGRPNVGKSSLLNRLVGFERSIVDATPGTTRDAVDSLIDWHGRSIRLVDTAGVRRRPRIHEQIEQSSVLIALRAIERAEVCLLVIDAEQGMTDQDARLIHYAWDRGRAVALVVNKWDLAPPDRKNPARYEDGLRRQFAVTLPLPIVFVSALTGTRVTSLLPLIERVSEAHATHLPTVQLNRCLKEWTERTPPPSYRGKTPRFFYTTQVSAKPPVIAIYTSAPQAIPRDYTRYLENQLRARFPLTGTPVRLSFRTRRKERKTTPA